MRFLLRLRSSDKLIVVSLMKPYDICNRPIREDPRVRLRKVTDHMLGFRQTVLYDLFAFDHRDQRFAVFIGSCSRKSEAAGNTLAHTVGTDAVEDRSPSDTDFIPAVKNHIKFFGIVQNEHDNKHGCFPPAIFCHIKNQMKK